MVKNQDSYLLNINGELVLDEHGNKIKVLSKTGEPKPRTSYTKDGPKDNRISNRPSVPARFLGDDKIDERFDYYVAEGIVQKKGLKDPSVKIRIKAYSYIAENIKDYTFNKAENLWDLAKKDPSPEIKKLASMKLLEILKDKENTPENKEERMRKNIEADLAEFRVRQADEKAQQKKEKEEWSAKLKSNLPTNAEVVNGKRPRIEKTTGELVYSSDSQSDSKEERIIQSLLKKAYENGENLKKFVAQNNINHSSVWLFKKRNNISLNNISFEDSLKIGKSQLEEKLKTISEKEELSKKTNFTNSHNNEAEK